MKLWKIIYFWNNGILWFFVHCVMSIALWKHISMLFQCCCFQPFTDLFSHSPIFPVIHWSFQSFADLSSHSLIHWPHFILSEVFFVGLFLFHEIYTRMIIAVFLTLMFCCTIDQSIWLASPSVRPIDKKSYLWLTQWKKGYVWLSLTLWSPEKWLQSHYFHL